MKCSQIIPPLQVIFFDSPRHPFLPQCTSTPAPSPQGEGGHRAMLITGKLCSPPSGGVRGGAFIIIILDLRTEQRIVDF